jgi:hypothetical protein
MPPFTNTPALLCLLGRDEISLRFAVESILFWSQSVVNHQRLKIPVGAGQSSSEEKNGIRNANLHKLLIHTTSSFSLRRVERLTNQNQAMTVVNVNGVIQIDYR